MFFVHTFSELTMALDLLWKGSPIHILSVNPFKTEAVIM